MAARRRRRRKNKNGTLFFCIVVEIIAVLALIGILGWRYGVADWISQMGKPVVQELDISGINSSHAVLMQARGGRRRHVLSLLSAPLLQNPAAAIALQQFQRPDGGFGMRGHALQKPAEQL